MKIELKILEHGKTFYKGYLGHNNKLHDAEDNQLEAQLPEYATEGSAAMDLRSVEDVTLYPGECRMIKTGIAAWIGSNLNKFGTIDTFCATTTQGEFLSVAGLILPRSGKGHNEGLVLGNTLGVLDQDYQGELLISAWNRKHSDEEMFDTDWGPDFRELNIIHIKAGERIAQLMFVPVIKAQWTVVDEFSNVTERGNDGWGSTGVK